MLTLEERLRCQILREQGIAIAEIAKQLGRSRLVFTLLFLPFFLQGHSGETFHYDFMLLGLPRFSFVVFSLVYVFVCCRFTVYDTLKRYD